MAKFYGLIGYAETKETTPGVWEEVISERQYYSGEVLRNNKRWTSESTQLNSNLVIDNQISILADVFAYENLNAMRYVKWMGAIWKITNVTIQRPRLILTLGGTYNGEENTTTHNI